jgi:hypothetical protein
MTRNKTRELLRKWTADGLTMCYCSICDWRYPATFDVSDAIANADALAVFEAHNCKDFPLEELNQAAARIVRKATKTS